MKEHVGLFFYVDGRFLFHGQALQEAEKYGQFLIYDASHFEIWDKYYFKRYRVDYDYYPRGRVVYDTVSGKFLIYRDICIPDEEMHKFSKDYAGPNNYVLLLDEHYRCHRCNRSYVNLFR